MNIIFTFTNSEDLDEMQHYAAFHLVFTVCKSTHLGVSPYIQKINQVILYWPSYRSEVSCIGPSLKSE